MLAAGSVASGLGMMAGVLGPIAAGAGLLYMGLKRGKKETTGSGIEGTASADGFSGLAYADWKRKGGFLRGTKYGRDRSAVDAGVEGVLDSGIGAAYATVGEYAKVLGLPVEAARKLRAEFKVVWGNTEEENKAAIESAIGKVSDQLAGLYSAQLKPFTKAGETLTQAMARLAELQTFSATLNQFGGIFSRIAGASIDARENIIRWPEDRGPGAEVPAVRRRLLQRGRAGRPASGGHWRRAQGRRHRRRRPGQPRAVPRARGGAGRVHGAGASATRRPAGPGAAVRATGRLPDGAGQDAG